MAKRDDGPCRQDQRKEGLGGKGRRDLGERKKARRLVSLKPCDQQCVQCMSLSVTDNCLSRLLTTGLPSALAITHSLFCLI